MKCEVAILAGGMGTRLISRSGDLPKSMVPVSGKPLLHHQIELCRKYGFENIALLVQYRHEKIFEYFRDGSSFGVNLVYEIENHPRGTFGALHGSLGILSDRFLVLYGDTFLDVDLRKLWYAHEASKAASTLFLHPNDHPQDSDLVRIDENYIVREILSYPHPATRKVRNLVNAGLYIIERTSLETVIPEGDKADIAKQMFPKMLQLGFKLFGYVSPEYIKDMGTPERLDKVERDFAVGLPELLSCRQLRRAVFLDRDGTINREVTHLKSPEQLELLPNAAKAIRKLNRSGILAVVVTNQAVIARGDVTFEELARIHAHLESMLGHEGAYIDDLYFCPHHPAKGFLGEVAELKVVCNCRKPEPGLIDNACKDLAIGRGDSWMVGDTTSDIEAGRRAGVRTLLLRTGHAGSDYKHAVRADYTAPDLLDAIDWILNGHADLCRRLVPVAAAVDPECRLVLIGGLARSGKSYSAQVLKELLHFLGRRAHIVSLDGWLKPPTERDEGKGVCQRFDIKAATSAILSVISSSTRFVLSEPLYDRASRSSIPQRIQHSIGPDDVVIVEGVPALLMNPLVELPKTKKVYIDVNPSIRHERLRADYKWRGLSDVDLSRVLEARELDETPIVEQSRRFADFIVE
jgi:histidinol-phosphate phosphatase family protein